MVRCDNKRRDAIKAVTIDSKKWVENVDENEFKQVIEEAVDRVVAEFKENTIGYEEDVREEAVLKLEGEIWQMLEETYERFMKGVRERVETSYLTSLNELIPAEGIMPEVGLSSLFKERHESAVQLFTKSAGALLPSKSPWKIRLFEKMNELDQFLRREEAIFKRQLLGNVKSTIQLTLKENLSRLLVPLLDKAAPDMWAEIRAAHKNAIEGAVDRMKAFLVDVGMNSEQEESASFAAMRAYADVLVNDKFADRAQGAALAERIFNKFDVAFNRGKSRVWRLWDNPDHEVVKARALGHLVLDMFSESQLYDDGAWPVGQSKVLYIDPDRKAVLAADFEALVHQELVWAQVTRANSSTHSTVIISALVLVLGWNEILWLICNPIQMILIVMCIVGGGIYYYLQRIGDWQQLVAFVLQTVVRLVNPPSPPNSTPLNPANSVDSDPLAHAAHLAGPAGREKRPNTAPSVLKQRT